MRLLLHCQKEPTRVLAIVDDEALVQDEEEDGGREKFLCG